MNITKENSIRNIILQVVILQMIARSWFLYQKRCRSLLRCKQQIYTLGISRAI